ncbi:zinc finger domain-containing protein [Flavobacterium sp. LHD-80]|uniref:zinc finger domain-containing protein n=1 Tax=Flavobacterium sp. LHD-80 TaxID=3071411 RepID=UPI0027DF2373|nr:zinc finger domain-containing protein [Flavobacterium sp. LHD-80]MDQ6472755.1 zinc finger domain-containing protein [Flavobacterium sp. LHD-80]
MAKSTLLSEFVAAQEIKMSPTLLRWFTSYSPKQDGRKLNFKEELGVYYYEKKELLDFNAYLHAPWDIPANGSRPTIPEGIKLEIKTESHYRCPLCNTNIGELAHIKPVARTFDNHPHNLIFLCPNHHTVYDFGFKYNNISEEEIVDQKKVLQRFQSLTWGLQSNIVDSYLTLINKIGRLQEIENELFGSDLQLDFEKVLDKILNKIDYLKTENKQGQKIEKLVNSVIPEAKASTTQKAYSFLSVRDEIKIEYTHTADVIECPLCHSNGYTKEFDTCPVCIGEGYIDNKLDFDISIYEFENCRLCKGKGFTSDFENCPPCNGSGKLTREQNEDINFSVYEMEDCHLCKGKGFTSDFENCPPCNGNGKLTRRQNEDINFSVYEMENCQLCKGKGFTNDFENCPPCKGSGKLRGEQIADIDFSQYEIEDCTVCNGHGSTRDFENCPPCNGTGKLTGEQIAHVDFSQYEMEDCPVCNGQGSTRVFENCPPCNGSGKLTNEQIADIDFSQYDMEDCPLCEGNGYTNKYEECPPCNGAGSLTRQQIYYIDFNNYK